MCKSYNDKHGNRELLSYVWSECKRCVCGIGKLNIYNKLRCFKSG